MSIFSSMVEQPKVARAKSQLASAAIGIRLHLKSGGRIEMNGLCYPLSFKALRCHYFISMVPSISVIALAFLCLCGCSWTDRMMKLDRMLERTLDPYVTAYMASSSLDDRINILNHLIADMNNLRLKLKTDRQRYFVDDTIAFSYARLYYINVDLQRPHAAEQARAEAIKHHPDWQLLPDDERVVRLESLVVFLRKLDARYGVPVPQASPQQNNPAIQQ